MNLAAFRNQGFARNDGQCGPQFRFYCGAGDLYLTFELVRQPVNPAAMKAALGSSFNEMACPDSAERMQRHRSHIVINAHHSMMFGPEIEAMTIEMVGEGMWGDLEAYKLRNLVTQAATHSLSRESGASLVHWTQTDILVSAEAMLKMPIGLASPLLFHPVFYGQTHHSNGTASLSVELFGAQHFLGKRVLFAPSPVPWPQALSYGLNFVQMALMEGGYIIPHGDTFGDPDDKASVLVSHIEANTFGAELEDAHYLLRFMRHDESGFMASDESGVQHAEVDEAVLAQFAHDPEAQKALRASMERAKALGGGFKIRPHTEMNPDVVPETHDPDGAPEKDVILDPHNSADRAILRALDRRRSEGEGGDASAKPTTENQAPRGLLGGVRRAFGRRSG